MTNHVQANLKNLDSGARWRGNFDGVYANGTLGGWAFLSTAPWEDLELDLYIHDIHVSTTITNQNRKDLDGVLGFDKPTNAGFVFDLKTFRPKGALELLRRFECTPPGVDMM